MAKPDTCCTLVPYFQAHPGQLEAVKAMGPDFIARTTTEAKCLHYAFSVSGDIVHCREGYTDADGILAHLDNVGALLQQVLKLADLIRLEVHGPAAELAKLKEPLKDLNPQYFELVEEGFRA